MNTYDVIISGGGMVGAVCANALAAADLSVALVEVAPRLHCQPQDKRTLRVVAVAEKHLKYLNDLGLLQEVGLNRIGPYHAMQVWDNNSSGELQFNSPKNTHLGAIIENKWLAYAAQKKLQDCPSVKTFYEHSIDSFAQSPRQVSVTLDNREKLQGRLLLACEGAGSPLRKMAGIGVRNSFYKQHAIVCYLGVNNAPEKTALQAFNHSGPVALLPMGGDIFSLVWSCDEDQYQRWLDADEAHFINGLQAHLRRDFGDIKIISERVSFPLRQMYADQTVLNRLVLMGDSAHVVHPLAGQGVNLGLSDVAELVRQIQNINLRDEQAVTRSLKRYQRRRHSDVLITSELMSFLQRFYALEQPGATWLRSKGMNLVNGFKPLKHWLVHQAGS